MMSGMDGELERELSAARRESDAKRAERDEKVALGKARITQFADMLTKNGVPALPMLGVRKVERTYTTEGYPGGFLRKAVPPTTLKELVDRFYVVDEGWPISPLSSEFYSLLKGSPAVTKDGRLREFSYLNDRHAVGGSKPSEYSHIESRHHLDGKEIWLLKSGAYCVDDKYQQYGSPEGVAWLGKLLSWYIDDCPWHNPADGKQALFIRPARS